MKVAFVVGGITSNASGLVSAVGGLAGALMRRGTQVSVYSVRCRGREPIDFGVNGSGVECFAPAGLWLGRLSHSRSLRHLLRARLDDVDLVHNHSAWVLPNHYASSAARVRGKPVVFSPHGVLEPWALANSSWKKRLMGWWFQDRDFAAASCFHALNHHEVAGMRAYGLRQRIAVVPNGVDLGQYSELPSRDALDGAFPSLKGRRLVLFMGRLHCKKGLSHLIRAWSAIARNHADWHLLIAGPDDGEEQASRKLVRELGLGSAVTFAGRLGGSAKLAALGGSEVFVLPSFSEGFSLAILEAMVCRLPILLTPGCNFPEVARTGAGIEVEPTVTDTERGLRDLLEKSDADRREMGARGRALIERQYTWDSVASRMLDVYRWVIAGGTGLSCVWAD